VLFIGNSLTAANDLPSLVEAIAKANGDRISTKTIAYPNYSLEDHWERGDAKRAITKGKWSFIVLQQGPSALAESRVLLIDYAKRFAAEANRVSAKTALFMVWPSAARASDFDRVRFSYESSASEAGAIFLPAGQAWRIAWQRDPRLEFYGPDGYHPTQLGSYLAALVIYAGLTGTTPTRSGAGFVSKEESMILREAALQALGHSGN